MILTNDTYQDIKWELETSSEWCVDVETNGLDPYGKNQICGLGICGSDGNFLLIIIFRLGISREKIFLMQLGRKSLGG